MSDQPSDSRPRPQYGEYATPEEQRARIRQPAPEATRTSGPATPVGVRTGVGAAPKPPKTQPKAGPLPPASSPSRPAQTGPGFDTPQSRVRVVDRIVTFALLTYGLVNVVSLIP